MVGRKGLECQIEQGTAGKPDGTYVNTSRRAGELNGKSWNGRSNKAPLGNPDGTYVNESKGF